LFDWQHSEDRQMPWLWLIRGAPFVQNHLPLPGVDVPEGWWDRFNIAPGARCEVSDSNMYSGVADGQQIFDHVWLFDAHHDLYRFKEPDEARDFYRKGTVTCEDWMWVHWAQGSKLHWRWPRWFTYGKKMRREIPGWVGCDARKDDLGKLDMVFDTVSICRSGAWVPPWCDADFEKFYTSCPADIVQVDSGPLVREFDEETLRRFGEQLRETMQQEGRESK
jgi:hypothetical protein